MRGMTSARLLSLCLGLYGAHRCRPSAAVVGPAEPVCGACPRVVACSEAPCGQGGQGDRYAKPAAALMQWLMLFLVRPPRAAMFTELRSRDKSLALVPG